MDFFDDAWINQYEKIKNELSDDFFESDNMEIKIYFLYCNKNNKMSHLKINNYSLLQKNTISKEELISIIKKNRFYNNTKYNAVNILKHHVNLSFEDIPQYITNQNVTSSSFLKLSKLKSITFKPTIKMFQSLNSLFFLFNETTKLNPSGLSHKTTNTNSNTKKIVLYNKHKTKRNRT